MGGVTLVVFADGKEVGDPAALRQLHVCRIAARDEMHRLLSEDILTHPPAEWNPDHTLELLKSWRAAIHLPFDMKITSPEAAEEQLCREHELDRILASVKDYEASVLADPARYGSRKKMYVDYLIDWDSWLGRDTYPEQPMWWKDAVPVGVHTTAAAKKAMVR